MWNHRNAALFQNTQCKISKKRRAALIEDVDGETLVGSEGIRQKDAQTCFEAEKIKCWQSTSIETWLKHVRKTRQRNCDQGLKRRFDGDTHTDALLTKRAKLLGKYSIPKFKIWRLKTHYETASQYIHSTKELSNKLKSFGWQIIE